MIYAPGRHFWWEVKQPDGTLTKAQKARIPRLRAAGEIVFIWASIAEVREFVRLLS